MHIQSNVSTRRMKARVSESLVARQFDLLPVELLVVILRDYLTIAEWSKMDVALCTQRGIRHLFLHALKSELIMLQIKDNKLWDSLLKKGVLKWIVARSVHIESWENKHYSHLRNTRISASIRSFQTIKLLSISESYITDNVLPTIIKRLPNLLELNISACINVMDAGINLIVSGLRKLQRLDISECWHITDLGLRSTAGLPNLQYLNVSNCYKLSKAALKALAVARPSLLIVSTCDDDKVAASLDDSFICK
jgi:hypothetical protein